MRLRLPLWLGKLSKRQVVRGTGIYDYLVLREACVNLFRPESGAVRLVYKGLFRCCSGATQGLDLAGRFRIIKISLANPVS